MEQLKAKFKEKCKWKNHSQVRRMLANIDLNDPDVISFLLGRGCLKCINLFLAVKKFEDGILLYIVRQPEIPLNVVKGFLEGNPKLFTDDVELPVQELTNCNRLDLLKLFRQMKREETRMHTSENFLKAFSERDYEMLRFFLDPDNGWDKHVVLEEFVNPMIEKICQEKARIWPKDIVMHLLSRIRKRVVHNVLQLAIKHDNDDVLQAVIEKFPFVSNQKIKLGFKKVERTYNMDEHTFEETHGTVLHYLAKNEKFDFLEEVLDGNKFGKYLKLKSLSSICDALSAGAPLKTVKAYLEVRPDLIQELNAKKDIFLIHAAMGGEQPEVLRFLVKENRLNPQERNAEGLDPILYKISKYKSWCQDPAKISTEVMEMLEYLFPLIYGTNSIFNRKFGDLYAVYWFSGTLKRPNLFNACTETFYGPEVNSMYPLLKRVLKEFDLENMWRDLNNPDDMYVADNGRHICAFLHDSWRFPLEDRPFYPYGYNSDLKIIECLLYKIHKKAFDSDGKLEAFIPLLEHLETIGLFNRHGRDPREIGFLPLYLPNKPTPEIVSRIYRILSKFRGKITFDLSKILRASIHFANRCTKYNKCGLIRAIYSHYPISSNEWSCIMRYYADSDRKHVKNREIFSQLDELMPVDCLLKHMVSENTLSLKHLCRLKIREVLEKKAAGDSVKFFDSIDALEGIPPKMKKYLHFAENFVEM